MATAIKPGRVLSEDGRGMSLPYVEPLTIRPPGARVLPEPRRRGEEGGEPCRICAGTSLAPVWGDDHFTVHPPSSCSLPGALWIASRVHVDSFRDLPGDVAAAFGPLVARLESAMLHHLPDVGRVHLYRWGDGGAHFHVWLIPRPLGMMEAVGHHLPLWEETLPPVDDAESRRAVELVIAAL
jgi:diadenosine tetraphosphate (Ap4A) HIT family hydrolase